MDLLNRVGQKGRNKISPDRMGPFQPGRRKAKTLLLAWMSASLESSRSGTIGAVEPAGKPFRFLGGPPVGQPRPMRGAPTTQSPAIEAKRSWRWRQAFWTTNDVSMDAPFAREVQFFVRHLREQAFAMPKGLKPILHQGGEPTRQPLGEERL